MAKPKRGHMRAVATLTRLSVNERAVLTEFTKRLEGGAPELPKLALPHFELIEHCGQTSSRDPVEKLVQALARDGMKVICARFFELLMVSLPDHAAEDAIVYCEELAKEGISIAVANTKLRPAA